MSWLIRPEIVDENNKRRTMGGVEGTDRNTKHDFATEI